MKTKETMGFTINSITWVIDPTSSFSHADPHAIAIGCGVIPTFFNDAMLDVLQDSVTNYGFFMGNYMDSGTLDEDGTFRFPGDPPQAPLVATTINKVDVFIYQHGVVAYRLPDDSFVWVRMD